MKDLTHPLISLQNEIENLKEYGSNAVLRRASTLVRNEIEKDSRLMELACGPDRPDCRPASCLRGSELSFLEVLDEVKSDEKRKSIFLDPKEILISYLIDFISGKTDALEIRMFPNEDSYLQVEKEAFEEIKSKKLVPLIQINYALADSKDEIISSLKHLIYELESRDFANIHASTIAREECRPEGVESLGTRWINDGRILQQGSRDIIKCYRIDSCCGNRTYTRTEFGPPRWANSWSDGNTNSPPPIVPPPFVAVPWNSQLNLFPSPILGTLTSDWGWRNLNGTTDFHGGIDIAVPEGLQVLGINNGTIAHIGNNGHESGVIITDGNRTYTYWHITPNSTLVVGQQVNSGGVLGTVAGGGRIHLHYAINQPPGGNWTQRNDGNSQNPLP